MKDAYDQLSVEFNENADEEIIFASVNGGTPEGREISSKYAVFSFPTVLYYRPGTLKIKSRYDGFPRTYQSIKDWALLT
jgi:hypothetical protein